MSIFVSLSQASKLVKKSKSTIFSYIKSGKLRAELKDSVYQIDVDDLHRAFAAERTERTLNRTPELAQDTAILRERLASETSLRLQIESERDYLRDELQNERAERRSATNKISLLETQITPHHAQKETSLLYLKLFKKHV